MQKKTDRRVRKTKSQLKTGLAQLMREKSIREITVKELVDAVDINRSTFYLHYETISDLLSESVNYLNDQFLAYMKKDKEAVVSRLQKCSLNELFLVTPEYLTPYLGYIKEYKKIFRTAIENAAVLELEKSYDKMFCYVFTPILERYEVPEKDRTYIMAFYIRGLMAIITEWLKTDCKDSIEYIITVIQKCVMRHQEEK